MKRFICVTVILLSAVALFAQKREIPTLHFADNGTFKIVQFTDLHNAPANPASKHGIECIEAVLDAENPDLIIFTGDSFWGPPAREAMNDILAPVLKRKIPYAFCWGNHDHEQDMTRAEIQEMIETQPLNCGFTEDGIQGYSNFALPVLHSKASSADIIPAFILYCFDSQAYSEVEGVKGYGWIHLDQIAWYARVSSFYADANGGLPVPAMAFFHIPLPEYLDAVQAEPAKMVGSRMESVAAPKLNSGLFVAFKEHGDVMATFVGHDHDSDFAVEWYGLLLAYGRYSGGDTVYNNLADGSGARVIVINESEPRTFRTWIRLMDGRIQNDIIYPRDFRERKK
ncbi:MAG: metallophosphoesterase family protein [Bacteroidales bacterium]|nr:metallophosphoesterase family protein [Bacteroidales bacterium]MDD3201604.1 metallophosphoesterase family protein [Bacteroidales bacterium]